MKYFILFFALLTAGTAFSQEVSRDHGRFYVNGQQITTRQTRELLAVNPQALSLFKKGKNKQAIGGILIAVGSALVVGDLVKGLVSDVKYPTAMTYIGASALVISIPVLIGKNKKIDEGIELYNKGVTKTLGYQENNYQLQLIANQNGAGLQLQF